METFKFKKLGTIDETNNSLMQNESYSHNVDLFCDDLS